MASNLLQGVLKHSAHERLDALIHDKDDSDDELVNVVRSISYFLWTPVLLKMPSFHFQEHLHALVHPRVHHRLLVERPVAPLEDLDLRHPHPPSDLPILLEHFPLKFLSEYSHCSESLTSPVVRVYVENGAGVRH